MFRGPSATRLPCDSGQSVHIQRVSQLAPVGFLQMERGGGGVIVNGGQELSGGTSQVSGLLQSVTTNNLGVTTIGVADFTGVVTSYVVAADAKIQVNQAAGELKAVSSVITPLTSFAVANQPVSTRVRSSPL